MFRGGIGTTRWGMLVVGSSVALLAALVISGTTVASPPKCAGEVATIVGTNGDDVLVGTSGRDVIVGEAASTRFTASVGTT